MTAVSRRLVVTAVAAALFLSLAAAAAGGRIAFGLGWQRQERDRSSRMFRWMATNAELQIYGSAGSKLRLTLEATSLVRARTLTFRYSGRVLRTIRVPARWTWARFVITVPAGARPAIVRLSATPPAQSASAVVRKDHRLLAVAFSNVQVAAAR